MVSRWVCRRRPMVGRSLMRRRGRGFGFMAGSSRSLLWEAVRSEMTQGSRAPWCQRVTRYRTRGLFSFSSASHSRRLVRSFKKDPWTKI
jgi:hypothetical protein